MKQHITKRRVTLSRDVYKRQIYDDPAAVGLRMYKVGLPDIIYKAVGSVVARIRRIRSGVFHANNIICHIGW